MELSSANDNRAFSHVGDEMTRGIELAITPVVFGAFGWLLDSWLGTGPFLMLGLGAFALVGTVVKMWFGYDDAMRRLEGAGRWARRTTDGTGSPATAPADDVDLWSQRKAREA